MLKQLFGGGKPDHPMADPREARRILDELPAQDPFKALEELAHWHESVWAAEGFKLEQRIQLQLAIDDAAQPRVRKLAREYSAAVRPSRFQENRLWTHVHEYWRQAGLAFWRCVEGLALEPKAQPQVAPVVQRALRSLGQHIKWMHLRYGPVDPKVWGMLNGVYALAEGRKVPEARSEFLKAAVFSASSPDSLLPVEVELAEHLIASLVAGFEIAGTPSPALAYWTDLAQPMAPLRMAKPPAPAPGLRCFGGGTALTGLQGLIQKIEASGRIPPDMNLGGTYEPEAALDVMQHLAMYWSPVPPERRHPRHSVKSRLAIVQGFDSVVQALKPEDAASFQRPVEEAWIVENVSAGGFGAGVPQIKGDWLKVGALIAMQPEGGKNWLLGVVRRVNKVSAQQARVGIRTLAKVPVFAEFQMPGVGRVPGILIPGADASAETLIVLRPAVFVPGINLELRQGERQHIFLPLGVAERGDDYEIARFRGMVRES